MKPDETKSRGHGEKRSRKLDQFISALLSQTSFEAAADAAGISRITAWRWLKDPVVIIRVREARRDAMQRAMARLQEAASQAVDCLCQIQSHGESESARVAAARTILEQALRAVEIQDFEQRLAVLESAMKGRFDDHRKDQTPAAGAGRLNGRP